MTAEQTSRSPLQQRRARSRAALLLRDSTQQLGNMPWAESSTACLHWAAASQEAQSARGKPQRGRKGKGMQGKLWGAKGREKQAHGSRILSFGSLHPVLLPEAQPPTETYWATATRATVQQRPPPFVKPLGGCSPSYRYGTQAWARTWALQHPYYF